MNLDAPSFVVRETCVHATATALPGFTDTMYMLHAVLMPRATDDETPCRLGVQEALESNCTLLHLVGQEFKEPRNGLQENLVRMLGRTKSFLFLLFSDSEKLIYVIISFC